MTEKINHKRCACWMCANSKHYHSIKGKCSTEEIKFLEEMFVRMACAIMDLESMKMRETKNDMLKRSANARGESASPRKETNA